jgi:SNF2 family DNA or RNA helicase
MKAFIELNEEGTRIEVHFKYDPQTVAAVKTITGRRWHGDEPTKHWSVPLDLDSARALREAFGSGLTLGDAVTAWGRTAVAKERNLGKLALADDAELERLSPDFSEWLRPYQRADVKLMATANVGNFNQPGTGKTVEVIASVIEAGLIEGPHLVLAPLRSIKNVWMPELRDHQWFPIFGGESMKERKQAISDAIDHFAAGKPGWLVVNWDVARYFKDMDAEPVYRGGKLTQPLKLRYPELFDIKWNSVTIDEGHKTGLPNASGDPTKGSQFNQSVKKLKAERKFVLTGTPMGGKPIKLWGYLNWLEPTEYTSKWRWAEKWLVIEDNGYGKKIGGLLPGKEDAFYKAHAKHMVRRLKREALPGLPPKVIVPVMCDMTPGQRKQYAAMARDAEVRIEGERISATNVLAEYTRLKQFANAKCEVNAKGEVVPTEDSGKLVDLVERLDEFGIRKEDPEPAARVIVGSDSKRMVDMVVAFLRKQGIAADALTGDTKDSEPLLSRFQSEDPEPYVIVMTTKTGGISLNMERASSVHILDETWDPDDQEQLEDRGDRGSRTTPLVCLYYRTRGTIQEYIAEVTQDKKVNNSNVLDVRRQIIKAQAMAKSL